MPPGVDPSPSSDPKLPRAKSRRRTSADNEWLATDRAERRQPVIALLILLAILGAAIVLIVAGLRT